MDPPRCSTGLSSKKIKAVSLSVTVLPVTTDGNIDVLGGLEATVGSD